MVPSIKEGTLRLGYGKLRMRRLAWLVVACCAVAVAVLVGLGVDKLRPPAGTVTGNRVTQPVTANGVTQPGWPRPAPGAAPASPPARVCGNKAMLDGGPSSLRMALLLSQRAMTQNCPRRNWTMKPHTTYWFAPGITRLAGSIRPDYPGRRGHIYRGAGRHARWPAENLYAFTQSGSAM